MKRICLFLLAALLLTGMMLPTAAATLPDPMLSATKQALDASLGTETPGAAVLIVQNGIPVMIEGFGYADLASNTPVTADTPFELGEISSAFVAVVALALAEEGRVELDADIAAYLPAAFVKKLDFTYAVTLRQLLLGRAGLGGRIHDLYFESGRQCFKNLEEALLADVPDQILPPDTCTVYSAFGVALAAHVLSVVTEAPFESLAQQYVFSPLQMTATVYHLAGTEVEELAAGYTALDDQRFKEGRGRGNSYSGLYPATGAVSTAADLLKFLSFLLSDAAQEELLRVVENGTVGGSTLAFASQGGVERRVGKTLFHGAALSLCLREKTAVLVLTNTAENALLSLPERLCPGTTTRVVGTTEGLHELADFKGVYAPATGENRTFVGRFQLANSNYEVELNADGTLQFLGMRLKQIAPGAFALAEGDDATVRVQFFFDEAGEVMAVTAADGRSFVPVPFYLSYSVATLSLAAVLLCTLWLLVYGIGVLVHWRHHREPNGKRRSVQYILPHAFTAVQALAVLLSVCVGGYFGTTVFAPFYSTLAVVALLFGTAASIAYVVAFLRSFFRRALHHRIAYSAIFFVLYQLLLRLWALVPL